MMMLGGLGVLTLALLVAAYVIIDMAEEGQKDDERRGIE